MEEKSPFTLGAIASSEYNSRKEKKDDRIPKPKTTTTPNVLRRVITLFGNFVTSKWADFKKHGSVPDTSYMNITSVVIPEGVTSIEDFSFHFRQSLTSVVIPDSVTSIGDSAFEACSSLTSITIPEGVTSIGSEAFLNCSRLTSVTIPTNSQLTCIGYGQASMGETFKGCSSLTHIYIPAGVTSIEKETFSGCSNLSSITIPTNSQLKIIRERAFEGCSNLSSIYIPIGVTSIGEEAFKGCSSLTGITIPNSVKSIGKGAFDGCYNLGRYSRDDVKMPDRVPFSDLSDKFEYIKDSILYQTSLVKPLGAQDPLNELDTIAHISSMGANYDYNKKPGKPLTEIEYHNIKYNTFNLPEAFIPLARSKDDRPDEPLKYMEEFMATVRDPDNILNFEVLPYLHPKI